MDTIISDPIKDRMGEIQQDAGCKKEHPYDYIRQIKGQVGSAVSSTYGASGIDMVPDNFGDTILILFIAYNVPIGNAAISLFPS